MSIDTAAQAPTVSELLIKAKERFGDRTAFNTIQPAVKGGRRFTLIPHSWKAYVEGAALFAKALIAQGVRPHDVVTIQGSNAPQWLFSMLGTILAGGVSAGIYPTNGRELCEHAVKSSGARVAVVEDETQLQKYQGLKARALKCIVVWNKTKKPAQTDGVPILSWDEFLQKGSSISDSEVEKRVKEQKSNDPCTLIYTSGTTGKPKAATLTHKNLTWTAACAGTKFGVRPDFHGLSFLPLCHIAALQVDCFLPLLFGFSIDMAPPDALKGSNLRQYLLTSRPTHCLGVPRIWEKLMEGIDARVKTAPFLKRKLFEISSRIGRALVPDYCSLSSKQESSRLTMIERIRYVVERAILFVLEKTIFTPIKRALGLDNCRIAASGAGALDLKVRTFFDGINLHLLDLYGMSESSGPAALSDGQTPTGSCGKAIPGTQIRILNPDEKGEGEILMQGPHVFSGYWHDEAATQDVMDHDGFLHTGDKGRLDAAGNLYITGRIKELIKTSGGENIPPLRIEDRIKTQLPIVSQAVAIGNNRKYLTCLVTLKSEVDEAGNPTQRLSSEVLTTLRGISSSAITMQEAARDPKVHQFLMRGIQRANQQADSRAQHIQKIAVLSEDFSIASGTMTPTLKLRRAVIDEKYSKEISALYV